MIVDNMLSSQALHTESMLIALNHMTKGTGNPIHQPTPYLVKSVSVKCGNTIHCNSSSHNVPKQCTILLYMCNTHTSGHPSAADEAWYWLKRVLHIG